MPLMRETFSLLSKADALSLWMNIRKTHHNWNAMTFWWRRFSSCSSAICKSYHHIEIGKQANIVLRKICQHTTQFYCECFCLQLVKFLRNMLIISKRRTDKNVFASHTKSISANFTFLYCKLIKSVWNYESNFCECRNTSVSVNSNLSVVMSGKMENRDGYSINFKSCSFTFICFLYFHFHFFCAPKAKKLLTFHILREFRERERAISKKKLVVWCEWLLWDETMKLFVSKATVNTV